MCAGVRETKKGVTFSEKGVETIMSKKIQKEKDGSPDQGVSRRQTLKTGLTILSSAVASSFFPNSASAQIATDPGSLVLKQRDLAPKVNRLFEELSNDKNAQKRFIEDPSTMILSRLLPDLQRGVSPQRISNANRLLYSVMGNREFLNWARGYQQTLKGKKEINKAEVMKDLAVAMSRYADPAFFQGLAEEDFARRGTTNQGFLLVIIFIVIFLVVIVIHAVIALGTDHDLTALGRSTKITPLELRSVAQQLEAYASGLMRSGKLTQQHISIR
jgi:hypothetical protein